MTRHVRTMVALAALGLAVAACGGAAENLAENIAEEALEEAGGGDVDIDVDEGEINVETSEGTFNLGSGELPDDWPGDVPTPSGCDVQTSQSIDTSDASGFTAVFLCDGDVETVAGALRGAFEGEGWSLDEDSNMTSGDFQAISFDGVKDNRSMLVNVASTDAGATVTIHTGTDDG